MAAPSCTAEAKAALPVYHRRGHWPTADGTRAGRPIRFGCAWISATCRSAGAGRDHGAGDKVRRHMVGPDADTGIRNIHA